MRHGFNPLVEKIPWRRKWQPMPVVLPGEFHGQRGLVYYSPWGSQRVRHDWVTKTYSFTFILFILLLLYSLVWNQEVWCLQHCSLSRLLWLFWVLCGSIQILEFFFLSLWSNAFGILQRLFQIIYGFFGGSKMLQMIIAAMKLKDAYSGSGWGTHVNPWLFHSNVWQNSLKIKK